MKGGILTFPHAASYGAVLQMYALQQAVRSLGHDVEVINYQNAFMRQERHYGSKDLKSMVKRIARRMVHKPLYSNFRSFEQERLTLFPAKTFETTEKLQQIGKRLLVWTWAIS